MHPMFRIAKNTAVDFLQIKVRRPILPAKSPAGMSHGYVRFQNLQIVRHTFKCEMQGSSPEAKYWFISHLLILAIAL
jgi:hypothetical protein